MFAFACNFYNHGSIHPKLQNGKTPDWAKDGDNAMLEVLLYKDVNLALAFEQLKANSFNVKEINTYAHVFIISTAISNLEKLANNPFVHFIAPIDPPSYPENKSGRTLHRSNVINAEYTSGRHYNGDGINIMMQDDGVIGPHIDYKGRLDQSNVSSNGGDHGDRRAARSFRAGRCGAGPGRGAGWETRRKLGPRGLLQPAPTQESPRLWRWRNGHQSGPRPGRPAGKIPQSRTG